MRYFKNLETPNDNEIFVFGSNTKGIHGAGAALAALKQYGAIYYIPEGLMGNSYAIPTKNNYFKPLPLSEIEAYVQRLKHFQNNNNYTRLYITPIGTGYSRYRHFQIAPMFRGFLRSRFLDKWKPYIEAPFRINVVNVRDGGEFFYVGRPSVLGNPFFMRDESKRLLVCRQYRDMFHKQLVEKNPTILNELAKITNIALKEGSINLGCHCSPKPCHADTIAHYIIHNWRLYV